MTVETKAASTKSLGEIPALSCPIRRVLRIPRFRCYNHKTNALLTKWSSGVVGKMVTCPEFDRVRGTGQIDDPRTPEVSTKTNPSVRRGSTELLAPGNQRDTIHEFCIVDHSREGEIVDGV